jgi:hypothetical protein
MNLPRASHEAGRSAPLQGLAGLMTLAFQGADLVPLAATLIERAAASEDDAEALMDLSTVLQLQGLRTLGVSTQAHALQAKRLYELRPTREARIRLLAIMAPGDLMTNTPLEFLIADSDIALSMLYLVPGEPLPQALPEHDVVFIAVSESDPTRALLDALATVTASWRTPVVNQPARIPNTSRTRAFELLEGAPGIYIPPTVRVSRDALEQLAAGALTVASVLADGTFPLIARPIDSHAGQGLEKIDSATDFAAYLAATPGSEFCVSRFIDYRGEDGFFRKYRIVLIDGVAYPGHMGVSDHWMIHYLNAGMSESAYKRAEEERFMRDFKTDFARRHAVALRAISERFELDYMVIDCGETEAGELLLFELCTGAVVHAMDPPDVFPYKRPRMDEIFAAFRAMLVRAIEADRLRRPRHLDTGSLATA